MKFQSFSLVWICLSFSTVYISSYPSNLTLEDQFIARFGNDPPTLRRWHPLRDVWHAMQTDNLKLLANKCHQLAGKGSLDMEHLMAGMHVRTILFNDTVYNPTNCEMLWYMEFEKSKIENGLRFYRVAQGLRPDCVFYIVGDEMKRDFHIEKHVCGIPISMFMKTSEAATAEPVVMKTTATTQEPTTEEPVIMKSLEVIKEPVVKPRRKVYAHHMEYVK